jgi:hypothetical protein
MTGGEENSEWEEISPLLNEAVAALRGTDRQAVLLRFFQGKNFAQVGEALGVNEEAARKRVTRAVRRLGAFFKRRGIIVPAGMGIMLLMARNASASPPNALARTVAAKALGAPRSGAASRTARSTPTNRAARWIGQSRRRLQAAILACLGLLGVGLATMVSMALFVESRAPEPSNAVGVRLETTATLNDVHRWRAVDKIAQDWPRFPRRAATFEITPAVPAPRNLDEISELALSLGAQSAADANWWKSMWAHAIAGPNFQRVAGQLGGKNAEPSTGSPTTPAEPDPDGVDSFADGAGSGGGGGVLDSDNSADRTMTHRAGTVRRSIVDAALALSNSDSLAADTSAPGFAFTFTHSQPRVYHLTLSPDRPSSLDQVYWAQMTSGGVRRYVSLRRGPTGKLTAYGTDGKPVSLESDGAIALQMLAADTKIDELFLAAASPPGRSIPSVFKSEGVFQLESMTAVAAPEPGTYLVVVGLMAGLSLRSRRAMR